MKKDITRHFDIQRDWLIIVGIFTVGLLGVSVLAWQTYLDKDVGGGHFDYLVLSSESKTRVLDEKQLSEVVKRFQNRPIGKLYLIDPSL